MAAVFSFSDQNHELLCRRQSQTKSRYIVTEYVEGETLRQRMVYRQLAPRNAPAHQDLGVAYNLSGQFEQVISSMPEAIRLDPNFAAPYRGLGEALTRLNRFAEAKETLMHALQLQLEFTEYHTQLYQLAFIAGDTAGMQQQLAWARRKPDEYVAFDWQSSAAGARTGAPGDQLSRARR
jgi:tetratricopeptide (TPR) repeat protein